MKTNDGGPAFPTKRIEMITPVAGGEDFPREVEYPGMSLRDWYAGQMLAGMPQCLSEYDAHLIAKRAFEVADFMLHERNLFAGEPQ